MDKTIEVENNLANLNPDVLLEFIDKLREAGYSIGISQYIAAQDLILILISQGENFDNPERLRNLLAPIFCSSQLEQENFKQYFDDLFKSVSQNIVLTEKTTAENQTSLEPEKAIKPPSLLLILPLIVIIVRGITLFVIFNNVPNEPIVKSPNPPTTKPTKLPTKTPNIIATTKPTNIPDKTSIQCTENIPPNTINWPRELAFFLTPAALFLISRMWWFWLNRQLFLRRYGTTTQPELQNISIADFDIEQELFPTMIFMQIARNLRRRIPIPSHQLDIEKTIDATVRQGGWLKPIYRNSQILPEYLFLVNRTSFQDHQAQFIEEIIQRLKHDNVLITSYFFDDDPLICFSSDGIVSPLRLDEIISKYHQHYLVLVSDTEIFFNIINGELEPWVSQLITWQSRAFLTPKPTINWGYQEFKIAQKFIILPATPQGLQIFSQKRDHTKLLSFQEKDLERGSTIPIPQTLRLQSYRWLERNSLEPEKIATMLVSLREYLGKDSFYWFCACAVFPELQWNITIYLGNVLKKKSGKSLLEVDSLTNLARLPWFRSGYIPDWLRVDLIKELTQEQEQEIRTALKNLLNQVNHTSGNGWKLSIAKTSVKTIYEDSPLQDYLFLDFMTKPSLLDLKVPEKFGQLLPKPKNQVSKKTQINRRRFLQMVGLGGAGLVTSVVGNQIFRSLEKRFLVMIDPGHGIYPDTGVVGFLKEEDIVLPISKNIAKILERNGIQALLTRNRDWCFTEDSVSGSLRHRVEMTAKVNADLFISIHATAFNGKANGCEIFFNSKGQHLGELVMGQLVNSSIVQGNSNNGLFNRGIKSGNALFVLRYLNDSIPSILVETGFLDNKKDVALLNNPDFQNKMAEAIAQGIILYKNSDDFRRTVLR